MSEATLLLRGMPALAVGAVGAEVGLALFCEGLVGAAVHGLVGARLEEHLGARVGHGCWMLWLWLVIRWFVACLLAGVLAGWLVGFRGEGEGVEGGQGLAAGCPAGSAMAWVWFEGRYLPHVPWLSSAI